MSVAEIKMKLGDIIKIESTNTDYNSYFLVEYIDDRNSVSTDNRTSIDQERLLNLDDSYTSLHWLMKTEKDSNHHSINTEK